MFKFIKSLIFIFLLNLIIYNSLFANSCVSYTNGPGRFGDQLLVYLRAEYLAYRYNLNLIYKPFLFSSELMVSKLNSSFSNPELSKVIHINEKNINSISSKANNLYIISYFPENKFEFITNPSWNQFYFKVDWKDPKFQLILKEKIKPINNLNTIVPPKDKVSIAIHFREGGGYDSKGCFYSIPFKFPPMQFYTDALLKVVKLLENKRLYCFVFTDALQPEKFVYELNKNINFYPNITFDYRKINNSARTNILEDFFSFFNFDILIRPDSNFSIIPSLINDYAIVISPKKFNKTNNMVIVNDFNVIINDNLLSNLQNKGGF